MRLLHSHFSHAAPHIHPALSNIYASALIVVAQAASKFNPRYLEFWKDFFKDERDLLAKARKVCHWPHVTRVCPRHSHCASPLLRASLRSSGDFTCAQKKFMPYLLQVQQSDLERLEHEVGQRKGIVLSPYAGEFLEAYQAQSSLQRGAGGAQAEVSSRRSSLSPLPLFGFRST